MIFPPNMPTRSLLPARIALPWPHWARSRAALLPVLACVLGISSTAARGALAQDQPDPVKPELSWVLARAALLDLGIHEPPSPTDYELAANLLSIASDLSPDDAELARNWVESAWLAGDQAMMIEATRRVIRIDPLDTVAQLRLVGSVINQKQTVEERMALYKRFLGDGGESLDPSVRSRLALDAALLERERGNAQGFVERLYQATQLDVSNKAAASLAAQYYASVTNDPAIVLDYQFRLLNADPLDANVQLSIAKMLAAEGAYTDARRFLSNAIELYKLGTGQPPAMVEEIRIALDWQIDGPAEIVRVLSAQLREQREQAQKRIQSFQEAQLPTDDLPRPEDLRYAIGIDKIRLLAAASLGDEKKTRSAMLDIELSVNQDLAAMNKLATQRGADLNALLGQVVIKIADLQLMRALTGVNTEVIRSDTQVIIDAQPALKPYFGAIEPMALMAEGKYRQSLEASEPYKASPLIKLVRARCYEGLGEKEEAITDYLDLAHTNTLDAYGAYAHARLLALGAGDRVVTASGRQMMQIAKTIPDWIDQMIRRPESFMYLSASVARNVYSPMDQPMLTVRLQNTAPIPMALGPSRPIDSSFLIVPDLETGNSGFRGKGYPKVVELGQRLRLRPRETLTVMLRADSAQTDWLLDMQPYALFRERYRLLQGFRPRVPDEAFGGQQPDPNAPRFGITNSPLGLTTETGIVQRMMLEEAGITVEVLAERLRGNDASARRRAVLASAGRLLLPEPGNAPDSGQQQMLVGALIEAYTHATIDERAWMTLVLPHRHQVPAMMDFDDHVASSILSDALIDSRVDPVVLCAALLTRTDAADAPIFETLNQARDPRVQRIAQILRARLRDGEKTLSTMGAGIDAMIPGRNTLGF